MAGIVTVFNGDNQAPGVTISLSGLTGFTTYSVTRQDTSGAANTYPDVPVRGADNLSVVGATATVTDYEVPLGVQVNYRLMVYTAGVLSATVDAGSMTVTDANLGATSGNRWFWLTDVLNPSVSASVQMGDFSEISYTPTVLGKFKVLGRKNPVVFTDVWGAREGNFEVQAITLNGVYSTRPEELEDMFQSGNVLLFRSFIQSHTIRDMYFIVEGLQRKQYDKPTVGNSGIGFTYQVSFQEVDAPITSGQATGYGIWSDLRDDPAYANWNAVIAGNATWADVLARYTN